MGHPVTVTPTESLWSLGITLWEVATLARNQPFNQVADQCFQTMTAFIGADLLKPIELQVHYRQVEEVVEFHSLEFLLLRAFLLLEIFSGNRKVLIY